MLKNTFLFLSCFFIALTIFSFSVAPQKVEKTIIVDPGHGGIDPGAAGLFSTEAEVSLAISKKLGVAFQRELPGIRVLFTRQEDVMAGHARSIKEGLRYRADFANSSRADLFISVHCNSAGKAAGGWYEKRVVDYNERVSYVGKKKKKVVRKIPVYESFYVTNNAQGTETFIWTANENSHKEKQVGNYAEFASHIEDADIPEDDPVINALKLVYTKKYFLNSLRLATLVQQEFEKSGRINRGVKQRNDKGIWVLHATGMPSILVEAGFISHKEEEIYMNSEAGQKEIVENVTAAVKLYFEQLMHNQKENSSDPLSATQKPIAFLRESNRKKAVDEAG